MHRLLLLTFGFLAFLLALLPAPHASAAPLAGLDWDPRLDSLRVTLTSASDCTSACWRLTSARYEDPTESGGTHHVYARLLEADGDAPPDCRGMSAIRTAIFGCFPKPRRSGRMCPSSAVITLSSKPVPTAPTPATPRNKAMSSPGWDCPSASMSIFVWYGSGMPTGSTTPTCPLSLRNKVSPHYRRLCCGAVWTWLIAEYPVLNFVYKCRYYRVSACLSESTTCLLS
jgi:hypothetical protein